MSDWENRIGHPAYEQVCKAIMEYHRTDMRALHLYRKLVELGLTDREANTVAHEEIRKREAEPPPPPEGERFHVGSDWGWIGEPRFK